MVPAVLYAPNPTGDWVLKAISTKNDYEKRGSELNQNPSFLVINLIADRMLPSRACFLFRFILQNYDI
jgi:hypothetical protein